MKCTPISISDKCPNGLVDANCIPYSGPSLANINTTTGQYLNVILSNINDAVNGGSSLPLSIKTVNLSADGTFSSPNEGWLIGVAINPTSTLAAFNMGYTPGGKELVYDQIITGGIFSSFNTSYYFGSGAIFYFGGITSSTTIKLLIIGQ